MLAEMPRQSVNRLVKRNECRQSRMAPGQSGLLNLRPQIECVRKISTGKEMRKTIQNVRREVQCLPDLTRCTPPSIGDDVRGHGGPMFSVTPIDFLDHTFPAIAARQIKIDIGPAFSAF